MHIMQSPILTQSLPRVFLGNSDYPPLYYLRMRIWKKKWESRESCALPLKYRFEINIKDLKCWPCYQYIQYINPTRNRIWIAIHKLLLQSLRISFSSDSFAPSLVKANLKVAHVADDVTLGGGHCPARAGPKGLHAESARAVTGRQYPHSGRGKTFWRVN